MNETDLPTSVVVAITLRCNSRCLMCDIWQKKINKNEIGPQIYAKLPLSLKDINLTGGEPFLRNDLPEIIKVLKKTNPKARLLVNTNGFLTERIKQMMPLILQIDPKFAVRVSLDGWGKTHELMRGIPGGFKKATATLKFLKTIGLRDLGIVFTLTYKNQDELIKVFNFTQKEKIEFSLNLVHESPIYFGNKKIQLLPDKLQFSKDIKVIMKKLKYSLKPKNWGRAWFDQKLFDFFQTKKRALVCHAGKDFFYMDPYANIYGCHLKNSFLGNLKKSSFTKIWNSQKRNNWAGKANKCNSCWMICTVKDQMKKNKWKILKEAFL